MKKLKYTLVIIIILVIVFIGGFGIRAFSTYMTNKQDFAIQKIDDSTNYKTKKVVEDTARAMISSYESDKLTYNQYKDSVDEVEQSWGKQAKMRANKTATTYNYYILENDFVWKGNVPQDIKYDLQIIE